MGDNNGEGIEVKVSSQMNTAAQQVKNFAKSFESAGYSLKSFKTNVDKTGNSLITMQKSMSGISTTISMKAKEMNGQLVGVGDSFKTTTKVIKQTQTQTKSFGDVWKTAINVGKLYLLWNVTKRVRDTLKDCVTQSVDFAETVNKFEVSMGSASNIATRFQNKLAEAFGTNRNEMMDYQSTFKNIMSSSAELSSKTAEKVSESLTQMGLDYSSLFNTSQKGAMEKFQSALVGSIRPIRADSGYDISNKALVSTAQSLGVDKTSSQLTEMEKRILRIITLMNQMKNTGAMQDLARTIESPSNQLKVMTNQLQELKIALGNAFMGTIGAILPYINGFLMALRAVISALSVLFGWIGGSGATSGLQEAFEVADTGAAGVASGLGKGAKAAKEIKKQLMGFDVLNVINTNKDSGSGSGGGAGGGVGTIDPKILGALKDYDSLMGKVKMKATAIRDAIMKWLGFLKKINPETGEIEWVLKKGYTHLKMIGDILKFVVGLFIAKKVVTLYGGLRNLVTILGGGEPKLKAFQSGLQGLGLTFKKNKTDIAEGATEMEKGTSSLLGTLGKLTLGIIGVASAGKGFIDLSKETSNTLETGKSNVLGYLGSITELTAGFAMLGGSLGGTTGAIAGGVIGLIVSLGTALYQLDGKTREVNKSVADSSKEWENAKKAVQDKLDSSLTEIGYTEKLEKELEGLVDSNGKVKAGYEDRVKFILGKFNDALGTEYSLTDGVISKNGEQIKSYQDMQNELKKTIELKKAEAYANANQDLYTEALKKQTKFFKERTDAQKETNKAEAEFSKFLEQNGLTLDDYNDYISKSGNLWEQYFTKYNGVMVTMEESDRDRLKQLQLNYSTQKGVLDEAQKNWQEATDTIIKQEDLKEAIISEDSDKIQQSITEMSNSYEENGVTQTLSLSKQIEKESAIRDRHIQLLKDKGQEATDAQKEQWNAQVKSLAETLAEQSNNIDTMTPEIVEAWGTLASTSKDTYNEQISKISPDTKLAIETMTNQVNLQDTNVQNAWKNMATKSTDTYNRLLGQMPENTRRNIENITGVVGTMEYSTNQSFNQLGATSANSTNNGFNNNLNLNISGANVKIDSASIKKKANELRTYFSIGNFHITSQGIKIGQYATGGLPDVGQMFVARESGPELVGKIGNQSAVVNNQQIVAAVSQGVASAVSSVMGNVGGGSYNLYIDGRQITDVVQERMNRNANIAGI